MKKSFYLGIFALFLPVAQSFAEQIAIEISTDQPAALKHLNGEEKQVRLPAIFFLEKNREYQFGIKGEKGFSYDSLGMKFSRPEKLQIRLAYEPYVIGTENCYWAFLLPGICGIKSGEHILGGSIFLTSVVGVYVGAFIIRAQAVSAKAAYDTLPAGTSQSEFDAKIKRVDTINTAFGLTLLAGGLLHFVVACVDGFNWGTPIYAADPRPSRQLSERSMSSILKLSTLSNRDEVVNYAYTTKNF
jgi:hypothetical protein